MLLGNEFISLLLTVFQGLLSEMCIPTYITFNMLPCNGYEGKSHEEYSPPAINNRRHMFSTDSSLEHCLHDVYYNGFKKLLSFKHSVLLGKACVRRPKTYEVLI